MARDRKRAKQRQRERQRRAQRQPERVPARRDAPVTEPAPDTVQPEAETVRDAPPDPVEHASGDVEIAEAAERAIADLDGSTAPLEADEFPQPDELESADILEEPEEPEEPEEEEEAEAGEAEAARPRRRPAARRGPTGRELPREGNRFVNFLRACWAELQRVQWPDRRQVAQATAVVLFFVLIAGGYLGLLDAIFSRVIDAIL